MLYQTCRYLAHVVVYIVRYYIATLRNGCKASVNGTFVRSDRGISCHHRLIQIATYDLIHPVEHQGYNCGLTKHARFICSMYTNYYRRYHRPTIWSVWLRHLICYISPWCIASSWNVSNKYSVTATWLAAVHSFDRDEWRVLHFVAAITKACQSP